MAASTFSEMNNGQMISFNEGGGDVIGCIYEYFLDKSAKSIASDAGVFFIPKSLVKMLVNILEPTSGVLLEPACGSGGIFVQTGNFVNEAGLQANIQIMEVDEYATCRN